MQQWERQTWLPPSQSEDNIFHYISGTRHTKLMGVRVPWAATWKGRHVRSGLIEEGSVPQGWVWEARQRVKSVGIAPGGGNIMYSLCKNTAVPGSENYLHLQLGEARMQEGYRSRGERNAGEADRDQIPRASQPRYRLELDSLPC